MSTHGNLLVAFSKLLPMSLRKRTSSDPRMDVSLCADGPGWGAIDWKFAVFHGIVKDAYIQREMGSMVPIPGYTISF